MKIHPNREVWKRRHYMNSGYRNALTRAAKMQVREKDKNNYIVQLGAYINARHMYGPDVVIASYQDSNVIETFNSPYTDPLLKKDKALFKQVMAFEKQVANDMDLIFTTSEYIRQSYIVNYDLPEQNSYLYWNRFSWVWGSQKMLDGYIMLYNKWGDWRILKLKKIIHNISISLGINILGSVLFKSK